MAKLLKNGTVVNDEGTRKVGRIEFDGTPIINNLPYPAVFFPKRSETGETDVEYSAIELREIAHLMDGLEKEKAAAAGK